MMFRTLGAVGAALVLLATTAAAQGAKEPVADGRPLSAWVKDLKATAPQVRNAWGSQTYMWHQMLAQKGYIIWICDNRTASGKGAESAWNVYQKFGQTEVRDLEDGFSYLKSLTFIDPTRQDVRQPPPFAKPRTGAVRIMPGCKGFDQLIASGWRAYPDKPVQIAVPPPTVVTETPLDKLTQKLPWEKKKN